MASADKRRAAPARAPTGIDGGEIATSEDAEGTCGVVCRGPGAGRAASLAVGNDRRRLPLHFLVEDVLGLRLRQGVPVGYGLDRWVVPGRRPAGWADAWRLGRLA